LLRATSLASRRLVADVDLTDKHGVPRCTRVRPSAVRWFVG